MFFFFLFFRKKIHFFFPQNMNFMFFPSNKPANPEIFLRNKHKKPKKFAQKQNHKSESPHFLKHQQNYQIPKPQAQKVQN